jgi:hypothetical protein
MQLARAVAAAFEAHQLGQIGIDFFQKGYSSVSARWFWHQFSPMFVFTPKLERKGPREASFAGAAAFAAG